MTLMPDQPIAYFDLGELPEPVEVDLSGRSWTIERGHPFTENGDIVTVILTTEKVVQAAYVNGEPAPTDHRYVADIVRDWKPPREWEPGTHSNLGAGTVSVFDKGADR